MKKTARFYDGSRIPIVFEKPPKMKNPGRYHEGSRISISARKPFQNNVRPFLSRQSHFRHRQQLVALRLIGHPQGARKSARAPFQNGNARTFSCTRANFHVTTRTRTHRQQLVALRLVEHPQVCSKALPK